MLGAHATVLETIGWMNLGLAGAIAAVSPLEEVVNDGHTAFRDTAANLVKL